MKGITEHSKRQKKNVKTDQHQNQTYLARMLRLLNKEFEVTTINTAKPPTHTADNMQHQMGGVNRAIEILRENQKEM